MKIFACDSTSQTASVAVCEDRKLLAQFTLNNGNTHSETLMPLTDTLLRTTGLTPGDIDLFACSAGPGSFTGVRIGVATVKGLAFGRNKTCIGVSTLEALARNLAADADGIIMPVMDARRGQFYTATLEVKDGSLVRLTPDRVISCRELETECAAAGQRIWLCGDGYSVLRRMLPDGPFHDTPEPLRYQSAYSVASLALDMYESGVRGTDAELRPVYLRLPQAERERLERLSAQDETHKETT